MSVYTMLVLTEKTLTDHDVQRIAQLHAPEPVHVHLVLPTRADPSTFDQLVDDIARMDLDELVEDFEGDDRTPAELMQRARRHLVASVEALAGAGVPADGELVDNHPVDSVAALAPRREVDEIIVITDPHIVADALRRDWATQLRHKVNVPVLHFIAGTDQVVS